MAMSTKGETSNRESDAVRIAYSDMTSFCK